MRRLPLLALLPIAALACTRGDRPWDAKSFAWEGSPRGGQWIRIRNTNGPVEVREAATGGLRVKAEKRWSGRRPEPVRFVVDSSSSGVTICAMWGKRGGECSESEYKTRNDVAWWKRMLYRRKSVNVHFVLEVPAGVRVDVRTVNGKVDIDGAGGEVRAQTVNGPVEASTTGGPLRATTVNGPIRARIAAGAGAGDVHLKTVNGPVTAELPEGIGAQVSLSTVNGRIDSDLPITVNGGLQRNRLQGTIGDGRHKVSIETVNGSVTLRKS